MNNYINNKLNLISILTLIILLMGSCSLIEGIFKAGFWLAIIGVVVIVLIIFGIVRLFKSK